jgi:hypothetical protein
MKGEIEKSSGQFLGLIVMNHWLAEVWIRIQDILIVLPLPLFCLENRVCLSHGVQVIGAAWWASTRIMTWVGDLVQRTGDGRTDRVLGGWTIERSGDAVCGLHHARGDEERRFLGWASKASSTFCQWFGLKITGTVFSGLTSKPVAKVSLDLTSKFMVEGFLIWALKPAAQFGDLSLKITVTISSFVP